MYHVSETNTEMTPPILRPFLWDLALDVVLVKHLTAGAAQLLDLLAEEAGDVLLAVRRVGEAGMGVGLVIKKNLFNYVPLLLNKNLNYLSVGAERLRVGARESVDLLCNEY